MMNALRTRDNNAVRYFLRTKHHGELITTEGAVPKVELCLFRRSGDWKMLTIEPAMEWTMEWWEIKGFWPPGRNAAFLSFRCANWLTFASSTQGLIALPSHISSCSTAFCYEMIKLTIFVVLLLSAISASAHGYVAEVDIAGKSYMGNVPGGPADPSIIFQVSDVSPVKGASNPSLNCGLNATPAALVASANPGDKIDFHWRGGGGSNARLLFSSWPLMEY